MTTLTPASWHSHVYFDAGSHAAAAALIAAMQAQFGADDTIVFGNWHHRPVGPHPDFSIQIEYPHEKFAAVMSFLALHRGGLIGGLAQQRSLRGGGNGNSASITIAAQ